LKILKICIYWRGILIEFVFIGMALFPIEFVFIGIALFLIEFVFVGMILFLIEFVRMFMVDRYTIFNSNTVHSPKNLLFIYTNQHQRNISRSSEVRIVLSCYYLCWNYLILASLSCDFNIKTVQNYSVAT
jgi:hypothetical protein